MAILVYIIKWMVVSGLLYGYYHLFLRNQRFHRYNRFYLLLISLLAFAIPLINIPVHFFAADQKNAVLLQTLRVINVNGWEEPISVYANQNAWGRWLSLQNGSWLVYLAGLFTGCFLLARSLFYIKNLRSKYPVQQVANIDLYQTQEPGTPFSFFKSVFWDESIPLSNPRGQQIFRHEIFHVKEKHSADVLLMEILCCMGWFNPFLHLVKKELKATHEFLADEYAASGNNCYEYAEMLVLQAINRKAPPISHPFFNHQIKRRIAMITQSNLVRSGGYFSRIMALPVLLVLFSAFAVKLVNNQPGSFSFLSGTSYTTVVIDAGHGGPYNGATGNNLFEKDITLQLAKKIRELSHDYNINVVLTRDQDALVGHATNLRQDLENRVNIVRENGAAMLVSIHLSAEPTGHALSGFEAIVSAAKNDAGAKELSSAILAAIRPVYRINEAILQRKTGVHVLDMPDCPSMILECGFITNEKDAAFIHNPANQEIIARKVLEGIARYAAIRSQLQAITGKTVNEGDAAGTAGYSSALPGSRVEDRQPNSDTVPAGHALVFSKVEQEAEYPGGSTAWRDYLFKNVHYPKEAQDKEIKGTVITQFVIDATGKVSDVKALSGPELLRAESIRIITESGNWNSAVQNGRKVASYKEQAINFMLERQPLKQ